MGRRDNVIDLKRDRAAFRGGAAPVLALEDLRELSELRCELEAMGRSVACGGAGWRVDVLASAHRGQDGLHAVLASACDSRPLRDAIERLREDAEQYRSLLPDGRDDHDDEAERRAMVDAAISGDGARLIDLVTGRIRAESVLIARALGRPAPRGRANVRDRGG